MKTTYLTAVLAVTASLAAQVGSTSFAAPDNAQTAPVLVSKAMAAESTRSNVDDVIQAYRAVIAAPANNRVYAAYAQYRIVQLYFRKGDLANAALEAGKLAQDYADYADLITADLAEEQPPDIFHSGPSAVLFQTMNGRAITRGSDAAVLPREGVFRHARTGVEIKLQGWQVQGQANSSGGGEMVMLQEPASGASASVWLKAEKIDAAEVPSRLRGAVQQKALQRLNLQDYTVRAGSVQMRTIDGKQAISALADYVENGSQMTEYLTWIFGDKTRVLVFSRAPSAEMQTLKPRIDQLVSSTVVP
jgi:hypothetical protein